MLTALKIAKKYETEMWFNVPKGVVKTSKNIKNNKKFDFLPLI